MRLQFFNIKNVKIEEKLNYKISNKSFYKDNIWDFQDELKTLKTNSSRRILFESLKINNRSILNYPSILESIKDLLMSYMNDGTKISTIIGKTIIINKFLNYMVVECNKLDVSELSDKEIFNYLEFSIKKGNEIDMTLEHVRRRVLIIKDFYKYRANLTYKLEKEPFNNINLTLYLKKHLKKSRQTNIIEDEDWKRIDSACLAQIEDYEKDIFLEKYITNIYKNHVNEKILNRFRSFYKNRFGTKYKKQVEHNKFLESTMTACAIIIQMYTGMRISELMSLKDGCIKEETIFIEGEEYKLKYIKGKTYKYHKTYQDDEIVNNDYGKDAQWLCPDIVFKAINVLQNIAEISRFFYEDKYVNNIHPEMKKHYENRKDSLFLQPFPKCSVRAKLPVISSKYKKFLSERNIKLNFELHSHCFRRTMARFFARNLMGLPIDALKDQFKHYSSNITMYYMKEGDKIEDGFSEMINECASDLSIEKKNNDDLIYERISSEIESSILCANNVTELLEFSKGKKLEVLSEYMITIKSNKGKLSPIECLTCNGTVILPKIHLNYWEDLLNMYEDMIEFEPSIWNKSERDMVYNVVMNLRNNNAYIVEV